MPMYEYACRKCEHRFERFVQGRQRPKCPECGSTKLEQQITTFVQGRPSAAVRGLNTPAAINHLRKLIGHIPTIPRWQTKTTNPGRRSKRSRMTVS